MLASTINFKKEVITLKKIFSCFTDPSTNYYGDYSKWKGGRQYSGYSKSGDKFLKDLSSWVSKTESPVESESRKEVESLFGSVLRTSPHLWGDGYKDPSGTYEITQKRGGDYVCVINLQEKSLTSLPTKLPRYYINIESLNLANNLLKEIPGEGFYTSLNMSGNPLHECLDSINVHTQFLDLKNCGIKELTTALFYDFKRMAGIYKKLNSHGDLHSGVIYEIDLSNNPLSEKSISLIEAYAAEGNTIPEIIYDKGELTSLKSSSLAKAAKEKTFPKIEEKNLVEEKKNDKYVSVVDKVVAGYSKQKKEREEKAKKTIEDFKYLTKHYGVENTPNIPNAIKPNVADFLKGLQPLSDQDLHFKEYVGGIFNELFKDKNATEFFSEVLKHDYIITFNKINECMLKSKVVKGEFDDRPELLAQSLRSLFLSMTIKQQHPMNESTFVKWESLLQDELKMDIQKKYHLSFFPPKPDLIRMKEYVVSEERESLKYFIEKHAIWKEFLSRTLPEA